MNQFHPSPEYSIRIILNFYKNFSTSFASVVDTGGKFATDVKDTGGKFATVVNNAGGKLPPVSTTPAENLSPV
jgi:hypothetical protein